MSSFSLGRSEDTQLVDEQRAGRQDVSAAHVFDREQASTKRRAQGAQTAEVDLRSSRIRFYFVRAHQTLPIGLARVELEDLDLHVDRVRGLGKVSAPDHGLIDAEGRLRIRDVKLGIDI